MVILQEVPEIEHYDIVVDGVARWHSRVAVCQRATTKYNLIYFSLFSDTISSSPSIGLHKTIEHRQLCQILSLEPQ